MSSRVDALMAGGSRRAAIILAALGEELATEVCSAMPADQVLALGEELSRLENVSPTELNEVLGDFVQRLQTNLGGPAYARSLLRGTLGDSQLREMGAIGLAGATRLSEVEPALLARVLRDEQPQIIAAVLTHLTGAQAGQLLVHFDEQAAADIAYRAAHLGNPAPGAMPALVEAVQRELRVTQSYSGSIAEVSLDFVVDLIGNMPAERGQAVVAALQQVDQGFGDHVAEQIFTFDDIAGLTDPDLQILLRAVDMSVLVMALKGVAAELRERLKQNLSQRGRERLDEEMTLLGPVPLSQVQEAQRQVCQQAVKLAEAGEIRLAGGEIQYVE